MRIAVVTVIAVALFCTAPAVAKDEERCGPELKKKEVEMIEVEVERPQSMLEDLEAAHHKTFDVIWAEDVIVTSGKPQKKALRRAAERGCPYVIVGKMVERPTGRMIQDRGRSNDNLPIYREEIQRVVHALFAVEETD